MPSRESPNRIVAQHLGVIGSSGWSWALNSNLSLVSDQFVGTQDDGNPQSLADGYADLGARLAVDGPDDRWTLAVFGRNLANTNYTSLYVYQPLAGALGLNNAVFSGSTANCIRASEPRTGGETAILRF